MLPPQFMTSSISMPLLESVRLARPECHVALLRAMEQDGFIATGEPIRQVVPRLEKAPYFLSRSISPDESPWQVVQRWHAALPESARHPHLDALVTHGPTRWFKKEADLVDAYNSHLLQILQLGLEFFDGQPPSWAQAYDVIAPLERDLMLRDSFARADAIVPQLTDVILQLGLKHYAVRVWERLQRAVDECNGESWANSSKINPDVRYAKRHAAQTQRLATMARAISAVAQARHLFNRDPQAGPYRDRDTEVEIDWEWEHERFMQVISVARLLRDFSSASDDDSPTDYKRQIMDHMSRAIIAADMGAMSAYLLQHVATLLHHEDPKRQAEIRAAFLAAQLKG